MGKKLRLVILIVCALMFVYFAVDEKLTNNNMSFDEKVLEIMNFDELSGTKNVDNIAFIAEVDDGYFCVGTASKEETVHFGYIKEKNGKLEFAGKSFSSLPMIVYNEDPTYFLRTKILNISDKNFYYGCYQHKDDIKVIVDNNEVDIHNFQLMYKDEEFNMDFWFVSSEKEPNVIAE